MSKAVAEGVSTKSNGALRVLVLVVLGLCILIAGSNFALVMHPVSAELAQDSRNDSFSINAHYRYYLDPSTLVVDLRDVRGAAPIDLIRGLFQAAQGLEARGRHFKTVILARSGTPVFVIDGDAFFELGKNFGAGENPIYLVRTLPEKLKTPDGTAAFGTWEGGLLGVVGKQIEDVNEMARRWITGNT